MLDFTEISADGNDLELLTRELLFVRGYEVRWSGQGPDAGRDLVFVERGQPDLGSQQRLWLVSCKHNAHGGGAVGVGELAGVLEACRAHRAEGFLLVCSTHPSAATVARLEALDADAGTSLRTHYWDATRLERLLATPIGWSVAQRFMPICTGGWRVWATESPNRYVAAAHGHWFHLTNRHSSDPDFMLQTADVQIPLLDAFQLPDRHRLRLRAIWYDDKHAFCRWYIDYLVPRDEQPVASVEDIAARLWHEQVLDDGQFHDIEVRVVSYWPFSDAHDDDHYQYYEPHAEVFGYGRRRPRAA